ncbi:MAG: ThuA domain-containing protein, partial [Planctomycetales bacterium]|nr:ThuA domain-containing protein [Planctomycetales bacterium]
MPRRGSLTLLVALVASATGLGANALAADQPDHRLLFLGDRGHHQPADRAEVLIPFLRTRGIAVEYTENVDVLASPELAQYDGLILYANIDEISPNQEAGLIKFVESGKGFLPLHCASFCFRNSDAFVAMVGAQFQRHGAEVFATRVAAHGEPIFDGFEGFTSWDETYIHHLHNEQDRVVLEYREQGDQAQGRDSEPWTWIRHQGKGRVFYTAWGHDRRTWTHPGYLNLVERGVRWACSGDVAKVPAYANVDSFQPPARVAGSGSLDDLVYDDVGAAVPHYEPVRRDGRADEHHMMPRPLPAEQSLHYYDTPADFALKLYAAEPHLGAKPIAMNWDERGRLWVCESLDYPNDLHANAQGSDRIRICEDVDGDGQADKFTVFAEGLSIPTAVTFYRGGAIVQNGVETLYLKDTDGDDRADVREKLITNWNLGDTHGGVSNFQYGLDNWIWAMQGYNNSSPRIDGKPTQTFRMGFWRFKLSQTDPPQVTDLEFVRSSNNNTWGLGISEDGLIFGSTANHNPSMFVPIPNRYYERVRGWAPSVLGTIADTHLFKPITENIRQVDHHGGYTAAAGHALYTARTFPEQWWNKTAFVCGPTGHLIGTFVLNRDGANYTSTSPVNLLASNDEWSAPIMAEVGPDGSVWVIDWYNYIVQHNPTPQGFETGKGHAYESDLRDKK